MKYYPQNSNSVKYIELPNRVEKNDSTLLIIQPKNHRSFVKLQCIIEVAQKEEIPTMNITIMPNNFQIQLELFENSDYLTLFRWMIDSKMITREFASVLYKAQYERFVVQHHHSQSPFTEKLNTSQNAQDLQGGPQCTVKETIA